ncbi:NAD(P)/FAD-dependent oxidoreductase [Paenibacillus sp. GbtcB18]|uniref:FAD-dependent oxidoreductase n=1 Tax=Paenibacillus sp. GbtcB18 TaxID=2824763 RepID=UPI001C30771D|nr:FAD-binding domain protein [Paenibacillus sp. GbtcB18]
MNDFMKEQGNPRKAIVIGNSMAGKLAARVLSDYFDTVTIIEQDPQPEGPYPRKGTPQSYHTHGLLKSGENTLDKFFPGIMQELEGHGGERLDFIRDISWVYQNFHFVRFDSGFEVVSQSRPLLEWRVHQRLLQRPNIEFAYSHRVVQYISSPGENRFTGVETENLVTRQSERLEADLIVDAAGSATKTPDQLLKHGFDSLSQSEVHINLAYATRMYERDPSVSHDYKSVIVFPNPPEVSKGGLTFPIEGNRWSVTLVGYGDGNHPPRDDQGFLNFAKSLTHPHLYDHIKSLKPAGDIHVYRFPSQVRRHYEKLERFPSGLVVMGDAFCRFNPVFGQGVSIACLEALELQKVLQEVRAGKIKAEGIPTAFHKQLSALVEPTWMTATSDAFLYPNTKGKKPAGLGFMQWYVRRLYRLSEYDQDVYGKFIRILHMVEKPTELFKPAMIYKVMKAKMPKPDKRAPGSPVNRDREQTL